MEIKYHAQFLLDKEKDSLTAKVRLRIKWNGKVVAFNLVNRVDIAQQIFQRTNIEYYPVNLTL